MENLQRTLNEYLFHECAVEGDESLVSEAWPFKLREVGQAPGLTVFEFDDDKPYFAIAGRSLNFMPKAGMTFADFLLQNTGSNWIGARDPVDLSTSMPGDASVPSTLERRHALEALGAHALGERNVQILEGLFLRGERRYLGLFRRPDTEEAFVAGLSATPTSVTFFEAPAWRGLAWGVGAWLQRGGGG